MTFRRFHPRTAVARWGLLAAAAGIVIGSTAPGALRSAAVELATRPENLPWLIERIVAFIAYFALAASVTLGLLASTRLLDTVAHRPVTVTIHKELAAAGLGLGAIHGALLGLDHSMPFSLTQIAVPFTAPYAPLFVAVGQVALYLMLVVVSSFYVRTRIGPTTWRRVHYLSFLAFAGATVHGIGAGTDSGSPWAAAVYIAAATVTVFLLTFRITTATASWIVERWSTTRAHQLDRARTVFGDAEPMLVANLKPDRGAPTRPGRPASAAPSRRSATHARVPQPAETDARGVALTAERSPAAPSG